MRIIATLFTALVFVTTTAAAANPPNEADELIARPEPGFQVNPYRWSASVAIRILAAHRAYNLMDPTAVGSLSDVTLGEGLALCVALAIDLTHRDVPLGEFIVHKLSGLISIGADIRLTLALVFAFDELSLSLLAKPEIATYLAIALIGGITDPVRNPTGGIVGGARNVLGRMVQTFGYLNILFLLTVLSDWNSLGGTITTNPRAVMAVLAGFAALGHTWGYPDLM